MNKKIFKKSDEELQGYLHFKKRGYRTKIRKGKGSYNRKDKSWMKEVDEYDMVGRLLM